MARTKVSAVPEVGNEAPEFNLPSAQGGQLKLSMRTVRGPVVVVFYGSADPDEDVDYFKALAAKEDEINMAAASVVGIAVTRPEEARELVAKAGMKSYILYDYARVASRDWGLLTKDKEHGEYARSAVFIVGADREVIHAWLDERPEPAEILAKVSEITGLPKPPEEKGEEKPEKPSKAKAKPEGDTDSPDAAETAEKPKREKLSSEEREKRRAERNAARENTETPATDGDGPKAEEPGDNKESQAGDSGPSATDESAETEEKKAGE